MPYWISITIATLREAKIAALVDACSEAALAAGQPNRAPGLIQGRVDEIRAAVASNKTNRVDADATTIPNSLKRVATVLIIADLKDAIEEPLTDDEKQAVAIAERKLIQVAKGDLTVEQPDDAIPAPVQSGSYLETVTPGNSGNSRDDTKGL